MNLWLYTISQNTNKDVSMFWTKNGPEARRLGLFSGAHTRTRGSAIAEEPRDALRQLKYYDRFLTELLTRSSANLEEPCEHTVS